MYMVMIAAKQILMNPPHGSSSLQHGKITKKIYIISPVGFF